MPSKGILELYAKDTTEETDLAGIHFNRVHGPTMWGKQRTVFAATAESGHGSSLNPDHITLILS